MLRHLVLVKPKLGSRLGFRRGLLAWTLASILAVPGVQAQSGIGRQGGTADMTRAQAYARASALETLGRKMFADPALSGSGKLACASCHDPKHGLAPGNDRAVQLGGKDLKQVGFRAAPSLKYLQAAPQFTEHYYESEDEADASIDNGPSGGLTWDGRADRARDQARFPLLSSFEMANDNEAVIAARLRKASYAADIEAIFGDAVLKDDAKAFAAAAEALEVYQQNAAEFYPYNSKYDFYLAGRAKLTPEEARGLALFNDPGKGNCGSCHRSLPADDGTPPQFTDFGMIAIAVPRNRAIAANADPAFFDLGLCGPLRDDFTQRTDYCGLFRTPSLRNVGLRRTFFHNGVIKTLRQAVAFYVERDTDPAKWYPRNADGTVNQYDDLPSPYRDNINKDAPFGGKPGDKPALSASEIDDVVAFLNTLTDGYKPRP